MDGSFDRGARRATRVSILIYGVPWLACAAFFWGSLASGGFGGGAIMGYSLLVLYIILPVAGGIASFVVGHTHSLGGRRFFAPFISAVLYFIFTYVTFGLSTALGLANIAPENISGVSLVLACAFLGLAVGMVVDMRARR